MFLRLVIALLLSLLVGSHVASAQIGGRSAYQFLNLPLSASSTALGGKTIASDKPTLPMVFGNPSLLDSTMHNDIDVSYINYIADLNYGSAIYARKFRRVGTVALGLQHLGYGKFERINAMGGVEGTFRCHETCLSGMYSFSFDTILRLGTTLKMVNSVLESYWSVGVVADFGVRYVSRSGSFTASAVLRNLGLMLKTYTGSRERLPMELLVGVSQKLQHAPLRFMLTYQHVQTLGLRYKGQQQATINLMGGEEQQEGLMRRVGGELLSHLILGVEATPMSALSIRVGYNHQRRNELGITAKKSVVGFSAGVGVNIKKYTFSYSCAAYHLAGFSHHISVGTNFDRLFNKQ